ncbi:MAG: UDP-N-acetylmuramoyl-tripeptide--D-alanyl-D-alanine ligase [Rhodocyclaceae bacterium]|nr:UDP-N-acetylmuramoyl-tripeptide--D-alanyl-D-alanine ligase [Rhodocyclaceae bacterium]
MIPLHEAAAALGASFTGALSVSAVETDTRTLTPGGLFVALRGERFDGHDFVAMAAEAGAAAAMVDRAYADATPDAPALPLLVVDDTRRALGALAAWWRQRFDIPLIGITGSNGKTTVKEMCAAILRATARREGVDPDGAVLATAGNFNNDIGLPLTLLRLRDSHRAAVIEMGMNQPGEIGYLTAIARPTVAIVNNALRAHLEGLGSVEDVAREKGSIYDGLGEGGTAIVNADDAFASQWIAHNAGRKVVRFGLDAADAEVRAVCESRRLTVRMMLTTPAGAIECTLQVPGLHNARNATGAAAACLAAGATLADVARGLGDYTGTRGRLQQRRAIGGAVVLDDTYNANPDSVRVAIDVLAATPGRKVLVLGDMGELGAASAQLHDEVGGYSKSQGVDHLLALGAASAVAARNFGPGGEHFGAIEPLIERLRELLDADTVALVKGSRFMRMERVVAAVADGGDAGEGRSHVA